MTSRKIRSILIISLAITLSVTYACYLFQTISKKEDLPVLGQVQDFALFDEKGDEFSLENLSGNIWIAN